MENSEWNERRDPKGSAENEEQMQTGQDLSGDAAEAPGQERTEVTEDTEMVVEETAENLSAGQELQPETESGAGSQPAQDQAGVMPEIPRQAQEGRSGRQPGADTREQGQSGPGPVPPHPHAAGEKKGPGHRETPAQEIRRASANPAASLILAALALIFTVLGTMGSWWLVAAIIGLLLAAAALFFAWHAFRPARTEMLAMSLAAAVCALAVFGVGQSVLETVTGAASHAVTERYYDDYSVVFRDPYDEAEDFYRDFFDDHDADWYEGDEFNGYWD